MALLCALRCTFKPERGGGFSQPFSGLQRESVGRTREIISVTSRLAQFKASSSSARPLRPLGYTVPLATAPSSVTTRQAN